MNSRIDFQSSLCHISVAVVMDTEKKKKKPHTSEEDDTVQSKAAAVRLAAAQWPAVDLYVTHTEMTRRTHTHTPSEPRVHSPSLCNGNFWNETARIWHNTMWHSNLITDWPKACKVISVNSLGRKPQSGTKKKEKKKATADEMLAKSNAS